MRGDFAMRDTPLQLTRAIGEGTGPGQLSGVAYTACIGGCVKVTWSSAPLAKAIRSSRRSGGHPRSPSTADGGVRPSLSHSIPLDALEHAFLPGAAATSDPRARLAVGRIVTSGETRLGGG